MASRSSKLGSTGPSLTRRGASPGGSSAVGPTCRPAASVEKYCCGENGLPLLLLVKSYRMAKGEAVVFFWVQKSTSVICQRGEKPISVVSCSHSSSIAVVATHTSSSSSAAVTKPFSGGADSSKGGGSTNFLPATRSPTSYSHNTSRAASALLIEQQRKGLARKNR